MITGQMSWLQKEIHMKNNSKGCYLITDKF